LHQGEHEKAPEVRRQKDEQPSAQAAASRRPDVIAEQFKPVRFVPSLRVRQRQQNVSLLAGPPLRQLTVTSGLRALIGQVLPPTADLTTA
jgi:hypothetical protein